MSSVSSIAFGDLCHDRNRLLVGSDGRDEVGVVIISCNIVGVFCSAQINTEAMPYH